MASLVQSSAGNQKPLNRNAKPFNPSLKCKSNALPQPLYQQPPLLQQLVQPSPAVVVMGMPVEHGVLCYHNEHVYQHLYHHHHQFSPLALLEFYPILLPPQIHTTKPSAFTLRTDGNIGGIKKVNKIDGGGGDGGSVGEIFRKVERKCGVKRVVSGERRRTRKAKDHGGVWVAKKTDGQQCNEVAILNPPPVEVNNHHLLSHGETTVMIRNIPNKLRRDELLEILDRHCRQENEKVKNRSDPVWSAYDFVYLPVDFKLMGNKGYAFVNFTTSDAAERLRKAMNNCRWDDYMESRKECDFSVARIQGREALVNHFRNSKFPTSINAFLPVVLLPPSDGTYPRTAPRVVGKCV